MKEFGYWEEFVYRASLATGIDFRTINREYTRLQVAKIIAVSNG